jgi:TonB family protein
VPKETSPFAAHEFDESVEHVVLGENGPILPEAGVHRLLDTHKDAILLTEGCDEGLQSLCSNLVGADHIERLTIEQIAPRLGAGPAGALVANASALGRQPDRLLLSWQEADPTVVIVVTGSKREREALLGELSGGLMHRFLVVPTSSGQARLVLASALKRHEELRRVGYSGTAPELPGLKESGFPINPVAIAAGATLLGVIVVAWWLAGGPDDGEVEVLPSPPVVDIPAPVPEQTAAATDAVDGTAITQPDATPATAAPVMPDPNNVAAQQGLAAAEQALLDRIALALVEGRVDDAEFALADLASASSDQPRLAALEAEINKARAGQVVTPATVPPPILNAPQLQSDMDPIRALVRQRISDSQLIEPAGDSARFHLDALTDAGDDAEVIATLETSLRSAAADQARVALAAGDLDGAEQRLVTATTVGVDAARLRELQAALIASQQQALLARATDAMRSNRLAAPPGDNAVELLTTLKTQQAALPGLEAALTTAGRRLSLLAEAALAEQDYVGAETTINAINTLRPESPALEPLLARLRYGHRQAVLLAEVVPASGLRILSYETPKYPRQAERRGTEGWVDIEFTVTVDGEPTDMVVVAGEPEAVFDDSALEALASAEFQPYSEDGDRFARRVLMRFRFNFPD